MSTDRTDAAPAWSRQLIAELQGADQRAIELEAAAGLVERRPVPRALMHVGRSVSAADYQGPQPSTAFSGRDDHAGLVRRLVHPQLHRSEERRVGKECRS